MLLDGVKPYEQQYEHPHGETYTERMRVASRMVIYGIATLILFFLVLYMGGYMPRTVPNGEHGTTPAHPDESHVEQEHAPAPQEGHHIEPENEAHEEGKLHESESSSSHHSSGYVPPMWAVLPFVALLLCIAILPLMSLTEHWWHHNRNSGACRQGRTI